MGASNGAHILGTLVPLEEPSTASHPDSCAAAKRVLLDHNVGELLELPWHLKAKRLRGLQVAMETGKKLLHRRSEVLSVCRHRGSQPSPSKLRLDVRRISVRASPTSRSDLAGIGRVSANAHIPTMASLAGYRRSGRPPCPARATRRRQLAPSKPRRVRRRWLDVPRRCRGRERPPGCAHP